MSEESRLNALIAARVDRLRRNRGLSIEELADRALLDSTEIEGILAGTEDLGLDTVLLLAGALGVETRELLDGIDEALG